MMGGMLVKSALGLSRELLNRNGIIVKYQGAVCPAFAEREVLRCVRSYDHIKASPPTSR